MGSTPLFGMLHEFQRGSSHLAVVCEEVLDGQVSPGGRTPEAKWIGKGGCFGDCEAGKPYRVLGIVTLEDVIEEMIGQEYALYLSLSLSL